MHKILKYLFPLIWHNNGNKCTKLFSYFEPANLTQFKVRSVVWTHLNNDFEVWTLLCVFCCQSMVGHWRESPLKMEHAWSQGWATECSKCLSLGLVETWPLGQRLSSQRRLCGYQHHSSQWPRNLLTMQKRLFSPHATLAQDCWSSWQVLWIPRQWGKY